MSFSLTTPQFLDGAKTMTRRLGWKNLRAGDRLMAVHKGQGLRKGEKVRRLGMFEVTETWEEPLWCITPEHVIREGFLGMTRSEFIDMFCDTMKCARNATVTVIAFHRVEDGPCAR